MTRAIDKILAHFDGNQSAAARALGTKQQNVFYWLKPGKEIPVEYIPNIAKKMGVKKSYLRPDIFK